MALEGNLMHNLCIQKVETPSDLKDFIAFPYTLYKAERYWVPLLKSEVAHILSDKNPFWEHAEKIFFLLKDGDTVKGRIAGIIDHNFIAFHEQKIGFFGFFETYDNGEYARLLLDAVKTWLTENGMDTMYGPMNPSSNDEIGFLLEGFDGQPVLMMPYTFPYYLDLVEACGMTKAKDLYAYHLDIPHIPFDRLKKITDDVRAKNPHAIVRKLRMNDFENEIKKTLSIYNAAWEKNWGFVPWTHNEFYGAAKRMKALFYPDTTLLVEVDGEPAGMIIIVPDYNEVMKHLHGKLGVLGILKFLWYKRKIKGVRLMILGVKKEFRQQGLESLLYYEAAKAMRTHGFTHCEFSWILEDNTMTNRAARSMNGTLYRKYRVYQSKL